MLTGDRLFYVFAGIIALVVGVLGATVVAPNLVMSAAVLVGLVVLVWFLRLNWWRKFYALTMILMVGATCTIGPLLTLSSYGRYVAAGAMLAVTWLVTRKTAPVYNSRLQKRFLGMLWFTVLFAGGSTIWSVAKLDTALQTVALFFLVGTLHLLTTRRWTDRATMTGDLGVGVTVLSGAFLASLATMFIGYPEAYTFLGHRFQGIFNNPNILALLAAVTIPVAWGLFREHPTVFRALTIAPAVAVLFLSESRTSIAAVALALVWMTLRAPGKAKIPVMFAAAVTGAILMASGFNPFGSSLDRFGTLEGGDALNGRSIAWEQAIRLTLDNPLGYGWQAGRQLFESLYGVAGYNFPRSSVHNSYLQFLLEMGFVGLIPLIYLVVVALIVIVRGQSHKLTAGLVGTILAGLIVQFTESAMFGTGQPYPYIFWFAIAGALTVYEPIPKRAPKSGLSPAYRHLEQRLQRTAPRGP